MSIPGHSCCREQRFHPAYGRTKCGWRRTTPCAIFGRPWEGERTCLRGEVQVADSEAISRHYGRAALGAVDLGAVILAALAATGKDVDRLTPDDLEPVDELHSRGRAATVDLAGLLVLDGTERILDLGCGIGGPSRYLARTFGCRVTGLDLTPEFCRVATMLAERTGLADKVDYRQGDALAIPFPAQSFDVVWSQNVAMNIADRDRLFAEVRRVVRSGGRYGFSDVISGPGGPPHFPVPWADQLLAHRRSHPPEARGRGLSCARFRGRHRRRAGAGAGADEGLRRTVGARAAHRSGTGRPHDAQEHGAQLRGATDRSRSGRGRSRGIIRGVAIAGRTSTGAAAHGRRHQQRPTPGPSRNGPDAIPTRLARRSFRDDDHRFPGPCL
jgi:SAM-dependent methyltransferase